MKQGKSEEIGGKERKKGKWHWQKKGRKKGKERGQVALAGKRKKEIEKKTNKKKADREQRTEKNRE